MRSGPNDSSHTRWVCAHPTVWRGEGGAGLRDRGAKRQVVETLVQEITVQTECNGKHKRGNVTIRYVFDELRHAVVSTTDVHAGLPVVSPLLCLPQKLLVAGMTSLMCSP